MKKNNVCRCVIILICCVFINGCTKNTFNLKSLAKNDIALVADAHIREINQLLKQLITKLYKRNPRYLAVSSNKYINKRLKLIFSDPALLSFEELGYLESTAAMQLCFDETFLGDRVFALGVGLRGMLYRSYNRNTELFIFKQLNEQVLYNSARNLEILAWRLSHSLNSNSELFLLSNNINGEVNLSFERLLGKMIALQDMMASITAGKGERTINKIIYSIASAVFLPVG